MPEGLKQNLVCTRRPHRDWARHTFECLSVTCGSMGQQWSAAGAGALGAADLGVAYALLEEVIINSTTELPELTQDWGNRLLEGTNKTLGTSGPRRKEQWPHKGLTDPDVPVSVQESPVELWVSSRLLQGHGHWVQPCMPGTFWRRLPLSSLPPPWFGLRSSNREGTQPHPSKKIGLKIYWAWPHPSEQDPVSALSQSLSSGSFHKLLILLHQRADSMKTTITEN